MAMEIDQSEESSKSVEALQKLISKGPLSSSLAKVSGSSKGVPCEKDFHFYNNFAEFKLPIKKTDENSNQMLKKVGAASELWDKGKGTSFPEDCNDLELEPYDWLVNVNDDVLERLDVSLDEFRELRKKEEESGVRTMSMGGKGEEGDDGEGGFQMVYGKKKNRREREGLSGVGSGSGGSGGVEVGGNVQVATKVKPKVPFHIPSVPRPQDEYKIIVNNSNQPFEHVWLQRSEDGSRVIHPLEMFSPLDFVDKSVDTIEPVKPPSLESTPFKFVEEVRDLKALAAKLRTVDEFAVDLEHNQYRSFQGLTCLMQISTRTEDFVVDTLKLRIHIGPYLREVFKDPTKKKVMHGSERDILWLQRDFGIYVCNMFDTGQASRVLKMERNSLEHLLQHFCEVTANKEYQNAEWRLRPLPHEMVRYAREDTHYLLYIYDLMRMRLLSLTPESEQSDPPLVEVYKRSYDICMQLYEKELLTDDSYLYIYGVQGADLNAEQLAVVAGLCEWRDVVARAEDESTGYILPNKTLIEIAKQMPLTSHKLRLLVKSKHPYIERNLGSVVSIIRHSVQNSANFKAVVEHLKDLKEQRLVKASEENSSMTDGSEVLPPESPQILKTTVTAGNINSSTSPKLSTVEPLAGGEKSEGGFSKNPGENENAKRSDGSIAAVSKQEVTFCGSGRENNNISSPLHGGATVQVLKKPNRAFGSLLGNSAKRKFESDKKEPEQIKLEQIKSAVNLPFHAFVDKSEPSTEEPAKPSEISHRQEPSPATSSKLEDVIIIDSDDEPVNDDSRAADDDIAQKDSGACPVMEMDGGDENVSLSDLSSSFQKCFQSINETRNTNVSKKFLDHESFPQLKPFDYDAAREQVKFGKAPRGDGDGEDGRNKRGKGQKKSSSSAINLPHKDEMGNDDLLPQGKRRQAFPASGNRSATFR